jgi:ribosomal protein S18 acetylase RimI-like enzyme
MQVIWVRREALFRIFRSKIFLRKGLDSESANCRCGNIVGVPADDQNVGSGSTASRIWDTYMTFQTEPRHDLSTSELDAIELRLYEHNSAATGCHDGRGLGFVIRDDAGQMIGAAAGYSWAGTSELKQLWVDKTYRGRGYGRALLDAFVAEARSRNVRQIWVASYDFQAPGLYERAGFQRIAEFEGWPEGHVNVVLRKIL